MQAGESRVSLGAGAAQLQASGLAHVTRRHPEVPRFLQRGEGSRAHRITSIPGVMFIHHRLEWHLKGRKGSRAQFSSARDPLRLRSGQALRPRSKTRAVGMTSSRCTFLHRFAFRKCSVPSRCRCATRSAAAEPSSICGLWLAARGPVRLSAGYEP